MTTMHLKNLAIGLGMTLGVQLVPGAWVKSGDYIVPNTSYQMKGGPGYKGGASGTSGTTGGSSVFGNGRGTTGGSSVFGGGTSGGGSGIFGGGTGLGGGGSVFGGGAGDSCGAPLVLSENGSAGDLITEGNLNDALPYSWASKFWLCGCPLSLEGSGLYWDTRPLVMCMF